MNYESIVNKFRLTSSTSRNEAHNNKTESTINRPKRKSSSQIAEKAHGLFSSLSQIRIKLFNTFRKNDEVSKNETAQHDGNLSFKVLEGAINALIEVAIPADLERLSRHKRNIGRWKLVFNISRLRREYEMTDRTIKQIAGSLQELEMLRSKIQVKDLNEFDECIKPVTLDAQMAVKDFMDSEMPDRQTRRSQKYDDESELPQNNSFNDLSPTQLCQKQAFDIVDGENTSKVLESMIKLQKDVEDLNELMATFSNLVTAQGKVVDGIAENIDEAEEHIRVGNFQLKKANILKAAMFPVVGAVVGGAVGGPVGLLVGVKLGTSISGGMAAAGVTGTVIGYQGGKYLKKKQTESVELEDLNKDDTELKVEEDSSLESFEILTFDDDT